MQRLSCCAVSLWCMFGRVYGRGEFSVDSRLRWFAFSPPHWLLSNQACSQGSQGSCIYQPNKFLNGILHGDGTIYCIPCHTPILTVAKICQLDTIHQLAAVLMDGRSVIYFRRREKNRPLVVEFSGDFSSTSAIGVSMKNSLRLMMIFRYY